MSHLLPFFIIGVIVIWAQVFRVLRKPSRPSSGSVMPVVRRAAATAARYDNAAAAIARCSFYIGNDSGLMHAAAAAGVPTVGLFGPSWPYLYKPWGPHTGYASTPENFDQLIDCEESHISKSGALEIVGVIPSF